MLLLLTRNGLFLTLACARICPGSLTAYRKTLSVPEAPVTANIHETFDIKTDFSSQTTFNFIFGFNNTSDLRQFFLVKIINQPHRINLGLFADCIGSRATNSINVSQCNIDMLVREVDSRNSSHSSPPSALALFVLGVGAYNPYDPSSANDLALIAYGLNARSYLHSKTLRERDIVYLFLKFLTTGSAT